MSVRAIALIKTKPPVAPRKFATRLRVSALSCAGEGWLRRCAQRLSGKEGMRAYAPYAREIHLERGVILGAAAHMLTHLKIQKMTEDRVERPCQVFARGRAASRDP